MRGSNRFDAMSVRPNSASVVLRPTAKVGEPGLFGENEADADFAVDLEDGEEAVVAWDLLWLVVLRWPTDEVWLWLWLKL